MPDHSLHSNDTHTGRPASAGRLAFALIVLSVALNCITSVRADDPPPDPPLLSETDIDLSKLNDWGTRRYVVEAPEKRLVEKDGKLVVEHHRTLAARLTLTTTVADDALTLKDDLVSYVGENTDVMSFTYTCGRQAPLPLRKVVASIIWRGDPYEITTDVADSKAVTVRGKDTESIDFPDGTLTFTAYWRLVTLLPREAGRSWTVPYFSETPELEVESGTLKPITLTCMGDDTITIGDEKVTCTRFFLSSRKGYDAWVNDKGELVRVADSARISEMTFVGMGEKWDD